MSTNNGSMPSARGSRRASETSEGKVLENMESPHPRPATMSNSGGSSSKTSIATQGLLTELVASPNAVAAGIGEVLQALVTASTATTTKPIMVEYGNRVMALGRKRMGVMSGRNAFLYLKSKFGVLNSTSALYLEASFIGEEEFVEVDFDAWEELAPHISKLRIIS